MHRRQGNACVVVASKGGAPNHPLWYRNIHANSLVEVEVASADGTERFQARARPLPTGPERDRIFAYMTEVWPAYKDYAARTERLIPIVILERQD
jgi:deazaflavin-dependent oxidoreductase (nitroreductase family)